MKAFSIVLLLSALQIINAYNFTCDSEKLITGHSFISNKWPNGIIKYELHASLTAADRVQVQGAFNVFHQKTCLRFEPRSGGEAAYVSIENDPTTCGLAHVGRLGVPQFAKFGGGCRNTAVMVHELGHTIGYGHEQTRKDRDSYVRFPCGNPPNKDESFNTLGMFYDYKSSMHYGCNSCLVPTMSGVTTSDCGQDNLSVLDVQKINTFYDCGGCLGYRFKPMAGLSSGEQGDLLPGGSSINGETLHVCRVYRNGDIIPGTGNIRDNACYVAFGGQEHRHSGSEVLVKAKAGNRLVWRGKPSNNVIPSNAIPGGRTRTGETLYIARATLQNGGRSSTVIGKVHAGRADVAFIPFFGAEHVVRQFEFLQCE